MATMDGAHTVTVSRILSELGITNRVFYNRFHNIDEVLEIVYKNSVFKMHESLKSEFDAEKTIFEYVMDSAQKDKMDNFTLIVLSEIIFNFMDRCLQEKDVKEANFEDYKYVYEILGDPKKAEFVFDDIKKIIERGY